jgi:hypothetical protein
MNQKVRIIKRDARAKDPEPARAELLDQHSTRDITVTIKQWVSEFKERRRSQVPELNWTFEAERRNSTS